MNSTFEPRNLFRNVYFYLAVAGLILFLYIGFIAITFLPRSSSEVKKDGISVANSQETEGLTAEPKSKKKAGDIDNFRVEIVQNGGWVDSDNRKITVVLRFSELRQAVARDVLNLGGIEIEINGEKAEIINSEPFKNNGFLTRAKAALTVENFDKFTNGETQNIEISTTLTNNGEKESKVIKKRFSKRDKTEVEGVKIAWK